MFVPQCLQVMRTFFPRTLSSGTAYFAGQPVQVTFIAYVQRPQMWRLGSPKHQNYHGFFGLPTAESHPPADLGPAPTKRLTDSGQGMSLGHLLRAAGVTLRISIPTLFDALVGRLTPEVCDARLDWWSKRLLGQAKVSLRI